MNTNIHSKKYALPLAVLFFIAITGGIASADSESQRPEKPPMPAFLEEAGVTLPENWQEMTKEEHQSFFEENGIEMPEMMKDMKEKEGKMEKYHKMPKIELPENWDTMTQEERKVYLESHQPKPLKKALEEKGITIPENWKDMTQEEKKSFLEASGVEIPEMPYNKNARKAKNFRSFHGNFSDKKEFHDQEGIKNQAAVQFLQLRGIIKGYQDGSFAPNNGVTRAESLKMIFEAIGEDMTENTSSESFADVKKEEWFAKYIEKAKEKGYVKGYEDGHFRPHQTVNKAELLKIAFRVFEIDLSNYVVTSLPTDVPTDAWFAVYFQYALDNGLLDLDESGLVNPGVPMTRDEFSELIYRLIQQQETLLDEDFETELEETLEEIAPEEITPEEITPEEDMSEEENPQE